MINDIIQFFLKLLGGNISIKTNIESKKNVVKGNNTVINYGDNNINAIGNNINIGPKIEVEKNDDFEDSYSLCVGDNIGEECK